MELVAAFVLCVWLPFGCYIYYRLVKKWTVFRKLSPAILIASVMAPGFIGLDILLPLPASVALVIYIIEMPGQETMILLHVVSWLVFALAFFIVGRNTSH